MTAIGPPKKVKKSLKYLNSDPFGGNASGLSPRADPVSDIPDPPKRGKVFLPLLRNVDVYLYRLHPHFTDWKIVLKVGKCVAFEVPEFKLGGKLIDVSENMNYLDVVFDCSFTFCRYVNY